jgi:hypothetical protein
VIASPARIRLAVAAAALLSASNVFAQPPEEGAAAPAATAVAPAAALDTPTRRPTRPWTPTSVVTPTETETAAVAAPTVTSTHTPPPTTTPTREPTNTMTPQPDWMPVALATGGPNGWMLLLGGAIALLATALGARIAGGRERLGRRRARRTLATAMLLELRRIDAVLRRVVALDNPASFPSLDHPIIEAALRDLTLFQTPTAARIAQFHGALRGIQHEIGDYRDNPLRWAGRLSELNQLIKNRAAAACRAVPDLMKALEKEGGAPPPQLHEAAPRAPQESRDLPPPPFGDTEGDDWTL